VVRDVLPGDDQVAPTLRMGDGDLTITAGPFPAFGDGSLTARIRTPIGDTVVVPLQPNPDGTFSGRTPAGVPGTYWASVVGQVLGSEQVLGSSATVSGYSAEYGLGEADPSLAAEIANETGGRVGPAPEAVFEPTDRRGSAGIPVWPWLVGVALALFLVDVALRRLSLGTEEVVVASAVAVPEPPVVEPPPSPIPGEEPSTSETMARLLRRKRGR
jgi:hypothetical protein